MPSKAAQITTGTMGWIVPTALKVNMDNALCDATSLHGTEKLGRTRAMYVGIRAKTL